MQDVGIASLAWDGFADTCADCPNGTTCAANATMQPVPCPRGSYCPDGNAAVTCAPGSYSPGWNAKECSPCLAGFYCTGNSTDKSTYAPLPCPLGKYSNASAATCSACPAGLACGALNTTLASATVCESGLYSAGNATACTKCANGTYSGAGATQCTPCLAGSYCQTGTQTGTADPPPLCPAGKYSNASAAQCTACPVGRFCPNLGTATLDNATVCSAGTSCPAGTSVPSNCASGTYSGWAVLDNNTVFALPFDANDTARHPVTASVGATCSPCPDGYACVDPTQPPALCPAGAAAGAGAATTRVNGTNPATCVLCPAGSYCEVPNIRPVRFVHFISNGSGFC